MYPGSVYVQCPLTFARPCVKPPGTHTWEDRLYLRLILTFVFEVGNVFVLLEMTAWRKCYRQR